LQILHDFGGNLVRRRQSVHVVEALVLEPEDVHVELVALEQVAYAKSFEAFRGDRAAGRAAS
jgi:hypothetical protein